MIYEHIQVNSTFMSTFEDWGDKFSRLTKYKIMCSLLGYVKTSDKLFAYALFII